VIFNKSLSLIFLLYIKSFLYVSVPLLLFFFLCSLVSLRNFIKYRKTLNSELPKNVADYKPKFALYFSAPRGSEFHIAMWIKYIEKLNGKFIIILREAFNYESISAMTRSPVIVCKTMSTLDQCIPESLTTIFYVNNGSKNTHMVRFNHLTHVQLLHGDSDKAPSFNPVTAMYDKILVAGQLGVDRYKKNGVFIPLDKFEIVGRPQLEKIKQISNQKKGPITTVLYAPTWLGYNADSAYSSILKSEAIVRGLLERDNTRVVIKLHPYLYKNKETNIIADNLREILERENEKGILNHIFIDKLDVNIDLYDCFNMCDALISDVSSVVSDFLFSEKPICVTDMKNEKDNMSVTFPISTVSYVLDSNMSNLANVIDELTIHDTKRVERTNFKEYVLGNFPNESYSDVFTNTANKIINKSQV
ncbi:hypothetical protein C9I98_03270, partial [Photobacterium sanctipauli]